MSQKQKSLESSCTRLQDSSGYISNQPQLNSIYIVGDAFKSLSNNQTIYTMSDFVRTYQGINVKNIYIEQGIDKDEYENIKYLLKNSQLCNAKIYSYFNEFEKCETHLTHKYKKENVLISSPLKIEEDKYNCMLMIDDACAELSDHVTGKHLQFMLLLEAARQMANAVTEKYYSSPLHIYLSNKLEADFKEFIYPFKIEMKYEIKEKKLKIGGNGKMKAVVSFIQDERILTTVSFDYTVLNKEFVTKIENLGLQKII